MPIHTFRGQLPPGSLPWLALVVGAERRAGEEGITSKVEGAVDAHSWLLLELPQALGHTFVHHQVQGLV